MIASFLCNGILFGTINSSGVIFAALKSNLEAQGVADPSSKACELPTNLILSYKPCSNQKYFFYPAFFY